MTLFPNKILKKIVTRMTHLFVEYVQDLYDVLYIETSVVESNRFATA